MACARRHPPDKSTLVVRRAVVPVSKRKDAITVVGVARRAHAEHTQSTRRGDYERGETSLSPCCSPGGHGKSGNQGHDSGVRGCGCGRRRLPVAAVMSCCVVLC